MKKFAFTLLVITLSFGSINASELIKSTTTTSIKYSEVNTFCKLITAGNYEAVKAMIESGASVNKKSMGMTPLMYAARYNKVKIVKLLISKGAKLKVKSNKGYTALKYAKISKAHEAHQILLNALGK